MATIIVQDKDASILEVLTIALQMKGFTAISIDTCDEELMLDIIDKERPHVVMMDIRLSDEDCINACKAIKQKYPHLPVIALSCNNNIHEQYDQHGFDGYISKPFDLDLLYSILRSHIPPTA